MKKIVFTFIFAWVLTGVALCMVAKSGTNQVFAGKHTTLVKDEPENSDESGEDEKKQQTAQNAEETEGETDTDSKEDKEDEKDAGQNEDENTKEDADGDTNATENTDTLTTEERIALQNQIREGNERTEALQEQQDKLKKKMKRLRKKKKNIVRYIEKLDEEMERIQGEIDVLEEDISVSYMRLSQLEEELEKATQTEQKQYEIMKKRIQYMYERGNASYIQIILQSHTLTDVFNRMEYMKQVSAYDNEMLENYIEAKEQVRASHAMVESEMNTQTQLISERKLEQDTVKLIWKNKSRQMKKYQKKIKKSKGSIKATENAIQKEEEAVEKLLAKQREKSGNMYIPLGGSKKIGKLGLHWPLQMPGRISSHFGYRNSPTAGASTYHRGVDIAVPSGSYILAAKKGKVTTATYQSAAGNYVGISHGKGLYTYYMHCSRLLVTEGEKVKQGQVIAYSGSTGISTGPHLHFGVFVNGAYVNPLDYVSY